MSGEKQPLSENPSFQQPIDGVAPPVYQVPYTNYQGGGYQQQPVPTPYQVQAQYQGAPAVYYQPQPQPQAVYVAGYPQQVPISNAMGAPGTTTVVVQQMEAPMLVPGVLVFRDRPVAIVCQHCGARGMTQIDYEPGACTWLSVGGCVLCGLWLGCCLIPLCVDSLKDVIHYCSNCHHTVGKFRRL